MCQNPKYNLKRRLREMPGSITHNTYAICIVADITERTLSNYCNTEKTAQFSIPSDKLFKMADFFNCQPTELVNG